MSQTVANLADVMMEVFTGDRLEKQFFNEFRVFNRIKKAPNSWLHGKYAKVPLHVGRSGGYSVKGSQGGALNGADEQKVDSATFTVGYNYHEIEVEIAAINEAVGGRTSVGSSLNLEVEGALDDIRVQVERQFLMDGTGLIAAFTTNSNTTVQELDPAGYGYDALKAGWLYPGLKIDGGTAADSDTKIDGVEITAVNADVAAPDFTIAAADTTATTDYVSISGAYDAGSTVCNESTGLRAIAGTSTSTFTVGGLAPSTVAEWAPAYVDSTTTVLSTNLLLTLQRKIVEKNGRKQQTALFSPYQRQNLYELLHTQVHYSGDTGLSAGSDETTKWNGIELEALPTLPDREVYLLTLDDLAIVTGAKIKQPTWVSSLMGVNKGMSHKQGYTSFVDTLVYPIGLACQKRRTHAAAKGLTA
jgi:hypothetical protein